MRSGAPAPAPARSVQTEASGSGQRSAPGRTGARPRGHGNPAPSRRESGPEPTEIRPRTDGNPTPSRRKSCPDPDPLPPFKNTYLTHFPFGSDATRPPLTPIKGVIDLRSFPLTKGQCYRRPGLGLDDIQFQIALKHRPKVNINPVQGLGLDDIRFQIAPKVNIHTRL